MSDRCVSEDVMSEPTPVESNPGDGRLDENLPVIGVVVECHRTNRLLGVWEDPLAASLWAMKNCPERFTMRRLRQP